MFRILKITVEILGIKDDDIKLEIAEELKKLPHVELFEDFLKQNHSMDGTDYKTGYQKFLFLLEKFESNLKKLSSSQYEKISTYADGLYQKTTIMFDDLNFHSQQKNFDINCKTVDKFLLENLTKKDFEVLKKVGNRKRILFLNSSAKKQLENEIFTAVENLSKAKHNLEIGFKPKFEPMGNKMIQLLGSN